MIRALTASPLTLCPKLIMFLAGPSVSSLEKTTPAPPACHGPLPRTVCFGMAGLVVLLMAYSSWHMGGLWLDENDTLGTALKPWPEIWTLLKNSSLPLGQYLLLKLWLVLTAALPQEMSLRALGFLINLGILWGVWRFMAAHASWPPGWFLSLFLLSPLVVRYAGTIRPYGSSALWLVLLLDTYLRYLRSPDKRQLALAGLLALLACHTHYVNVLIVVGLLLAAVVAAPRRSLPLVLSALLPLLSMGVYVPTLTQSQLTSTVAAAGEYDYLRPFSVISNLLSGETGLPLPFWLIGVAAVLGSLLATRQKEDVIVRYCALAPCLVVTLCMAFHLGARTAFSLWYPIPWLAVTVACLDCLLARSKWPRTVVQVAAPSLVFLALALFYLALPPLRQPQSTVDRTARYVEARVRPGDVIVVPHIFNAFTWNYHYRGQHPWHGIPQLTDYSVLRWDLFLRANREKTYRPQYLLYLCRDALRRGNRVFVVGGVRYFGPADSQERLTQNLIWEAEFYRFLAERPRSQQQLHFLEEEGQRETYFENLELNIFQGLKKSGEEKRTP